MNTDDLTPEGQALLDAMSALTENISGVMQGESVDVCLAALLNNLGRMLQVLARDGQHGDVLVRAAVALDALTTMAAQHSGMFDETAPGAESSAGEKTALGAESSALPPGKKGLH